jgi:hypothetical protein
MVESKKRNPSIHLSGLEWGVPGWVTEWWNTESDATGMVKYTVDKNHAMLGQDAGVRVGGDVTDPSGTNQSATSLNVTETSEIASTDECDATRPQQQWLFSYHGYDGPLCNADSKCLNVPACSQTQPLLFYSRWLLSITMLSARQTAGVP